MRRPRAFPRPRFVNIYRADAEQYESKFYLHMFQQDAAIGVMPFRSELQNYSDLTINITAPDSLKSGALDLLGSIGREEWYDEAEVVNAAIGRIAQLLVWEGRVHFEIISGDKDCGPTLHNFSERGLVRVPWGFVQLVPRSQQPFLEQRWAWLSHAAVWTVSLPEALGGWKQHRRMMRTLGALRETGPLFLRRDLEQRKWPAEYDAKKYHRAVKIAVFWATRKWGWIARDWQDDETTEYYKFDRTITQHWAKATLRNHIVSEINILLARILPGSSIAVSGLPSPDLITKIQQKLRRGELDFKAAMDAIAPARA